MSTRCTGWRVVCPDGQYRHNPYHNEGDATVLVYADVMTLIEVRPMFSTQREIDNAPITAMFHLDVQPVVGGLFQVYAYADLNGPYRIVAQTTSRESATAVIRLLRVGT